MPRQLRIEYAGAIYHVMNRGDRREPIFHDDLDRKRFVAALGEACTKTDWQVHAYCLMNNHFHLVLETPNANLVAGMELILAAARGTLDGPIRAGLASGHRQTARGDGRFGRLMP
jgi:REP element-mobilizing transposase RayT